MQYSETLKSEKTNALTIKKTPDLLKHQKAEAGLTESGRD